jgi:hypothetical protein
MSKLAKSFSFSGLGTPKISSDAKNLIPLITDNFLFDKVHKFSGIKKQKHQSRNPPIVS